MFEDYAGAFVWHCHILEHEDSDMMRPLNTCAPPGLFGSGIGSIVDGQGACRQAKCTSPDETVLYDTRTGFMPGL